MSLVGKLTRRFVFESKSLTQSKNHSTFTSFIGAISIVGLSLGVTALLVVTSVMNGFEKEIKKNLLSFHSHIILFSKAEPIANPVEQAQTIKNLDPNIVAVSPYLFAEVMLSANQSLAGAVIEALDVNTIDEVSAVRSKMVQGTLPQAKESLNGDAVQIVLGQELARKLKVSIQDQIWLTIPFARDDQTPLVKKAQVVGIVKLGKYDYDSKYALLELSELQNLLQLKNKVNAFKIKTSNAETSYQVAERLNDKLVYPLKARDWSSLERNLFYAVKLEKVVISIILMIIVLVASFNVVSTITMLVYDKKRQIAMLKALGFTQRNTFRVFAAIALALAMLGVFFGVIFGRALCAVVSWKSIIDLPADVYMLSRLPIEIRLLEWGALGLSVVFLALAASFYPTYLYSKEPPVEGLRYE